MSRSGYVEDTDDWLAYGRWRGVVASAIRGQRGQALLREMAAALDAMPVKQLFPDHLENDGERCALGVVGRARGIKMSAVDPDDPHAVAKAFNISSALAAEIAYLNDENYGDLTPERRWELMRRWCHQNITVQPGVTPVEVAH